MPRSREAKLLRHQGSATSLIVYTILLLLLRRRLLLLLLLLLLLAPTLRPITWLHGLIKRVENIPPKNTFSKCRLAEMKTYDAPIGVGGTPQSAPMAAHPWGENRRTADARTSRT